MDSIGILVLIVLAVIIACIIGAVHQAKKTSEANEAFVKQVSGEDFTVERTISAGESMLLIDNGRKKWCAKASNESIPKIYNFKDLNEFEVYEDGDSIAKGRAGSALVGGLLFGGVGAIVGASRSRNIKNTCTTLQVRIRVNDFTNPEIVMPIISSETKKDSIVYNMGITQAKEIASNLSYIQNDGKNLEVDTQNIEQSSISDNVGDSIRELSKLKEEGLLSEEEYNEKKKELISRM